MGIYINKGNEGFKSVLRGEYVDKTELISIVNATLSTERRYSCVSRCRRFGKSVAAKMLAAYYDHSVDSRNMFASLQIASDPTFEEHLNKYPVIYLDITGFTTRYHGDDSIVDHIDRALLNDVAQAYPQVPVKEGYDLMDLLVHVNQATGQQFIFIIDEWDAICREFKSGTSAMDRYVNWLRRLFKDVSGTYVFAGVYMTGILPVKKYKTESALNNFTEYSMVTPRSMASFFGFTKEEVQALAERHSMDFDELEKWYDGYQIGGIHSMFNPNSVMQAVYNDWCESYWGKTGSYEAVADFIQMNFEGIKDDVIKMLAGGRCRVNPTGFQNDMSVLNSRDDVFTLLIHLGYLSYDRTKGECYIPNREVWGEMTNAVKANRWQHVAEALQASQQLLQATLDGDAEAVARGVELAHDEHTSILSYNNENSMACVLSIAYYFARNDYVFHRELPSGKGFADLVMLPRKHVDLPAIIVELKYANTEAEGAISQIKRKEYPAKVAQHTDNLLLVGITYDKTTKRHKCLIESYGKS